jgi:hypothetical protein
MKNETGGMPHMVSNELYAYQECDINQLFEKIEGHAINYRLL